MGVDMPIATLIARYCNLSILEKIDLFLCSLNIWQPYSIAPLNTERYRLSSMLECEMLDAHGIDQCSDQFQLVAI